MNLEEALQSAAADHQAERFEEAESAYKKYFGAVHFLDRKHRSERLFSANVWPLCTFSGLYKKTCRPIQFHARTLP